MDVSSVYRISWPGVMQSAINLARRLKGKKIWGVPRGGTIVAALMAYHGCLLEADFEQADFVIDDIADTGTTLMSYGEPTAALVVRNGCNTLPKYWSMMVATKQYILFPWEDEQEAVEYMNTHYNVETEGEN